ncbi:Basic blue protein [Musa troglodytarum]|uniref:Basic blue protein n=1 Tax=Musa troglodytarum TaxID=320322 RepID=A0A9E7GH38_9LILI|nr:Basic blue protein [Musa troglodytarum]
MEGRTFIAALALICLCLFYHLEITAATEFTVGDSAGWSFNVENWPNGKSFKAGDVLVFKYGQERITWWWSMPKAIIAANPSLALRPTHLGTIRSLWLKEPVISSAPILVTVRPP